MNAAPCPPDPRTFGANTVSPLATSDCATGDQAGRSWARATPRRRADVLHAWWELLVAHTEQLAHLITREMGKPLAEARAEVKYGSDFVRWYAEEAVRPGGDFREAPDGGANILTRRAPVGLAVLITPWNFPLAMATRKVGPALAAGCTAVIKPAVKPEANALTVAKAWPLADDAELAARLTEARTLVDPGALLVQERIPGGGEAQWSYAALCDDGKELAHVTARRTRPARTPTDRRSAFDAPVACLP